MQLKNFKIILISLFIFFTVSTQITNSQEVEEAVVPTEEDVPQELLDIQDRIKNQEIEIQEIEKEIRETEKELEKVNNEKQSLQKEVDRNNLSLRKVTGDLNLVSKKIVITNSELNNLSTDIIQKTEEVDILKITLSELYRRINELENINLIYAIFSSENVSIFEALREANDLTEINEGIKNQVEEYVRLTTNLKIDREEISRQKRQLDNLKKEHDARRIIISGIQQEKNTLLNQTKQEEAEYNKILEEKKQARLEIALELIDFQSKLEFIIDPDSIPKPKLGVLSWPKSKPIRVTQEYGRTAFAVKNAYRYGRPFHNGVDISANVGEKVLSAQSGEVIGLGNTDIKRTCQSWGKWVLIEHENGLTTIYAHLSHIAVSKGQKLTRGEILGYSGNTGFSTNPHIHFGLYASSGIKIVPYEEISTSGRCSGLLLPVASDSARIDPMKYLELL